MFLLTTNHKAPGRGQLSKGKKMTTNIEQKSFSEIVDMNTEGLVLLGCGGNLNEWIDGVTGILAEEKIVLSANPSDSFDDPFYLKTTGGRTDLVMPFKKGAKINIRKLAIWRIKFGDASWISDYIVNFANQHGFENQPETAY